MPRFFSCLMVGLLVAACSGEAGSDSTTATEDLTTGRNVNQPISSCAGRKPCVNAAVIRILFSSKLQLVSHDGSVRPASEVVAEWLAKENDGRIRIDVQPAAGGRSNVSVILTAGHETSTDEGDIEALPFSFTIDATRVVEEKVEAQFAG